MSDKDKTESETDCGDSEMGVGDVHEVNSEIGVGDVQDVSDVRHYSFKNWSSALGQAWKLIGKDTISTMDLYEVFTKYKFRIGQHWNSFDS